MEVFQDLLCEPDESKVPLAQLQDAVHCSDPPHVGIGDYSMMGLHMVIVSHLFLTKISEEGQWLAYITVSPLGLLDHLFPHSSLLF